MPSVEGLATPQAGPAVTEAGNEGAPVAGGDRQLRDGRVLGVPDRDHAKHISRHFDARALGAAVATLLPLWSQQAGFHHPSPGYSVTHGCRLNSSR